MASLNKRQVCSSSARSTDLMGTLVLPIVVSVAAKLILNFLARR